MGGLVADSWGWRWVFVPLVPVALAGFVGALAYIPRYRGTPMPLDLAGAVTLTVAAALLILGFALLSQPDVTLVVAVGALVGGALTLAWFVRHCLRVAEPFVQVNLVAESRFARSCLAAFAQMFCLGATLLAIPLFLLGRGASASLAGLVLVAVPMTMAILAPLVGRWSDRLRPRRVLRAGLVALCCAQASLAVATGRDAPVVLVVLTLVATGVGIALVQTPAATGATRSPAGAQGTGLGVFNLVRFGGSAVGAAWVAVALDISTYPAVFAVSAGVVALGLAGSFVGPDPQPG
jgi:MFS family permease